MKRSKEQLKLLRAENRKYSRTVWVDVPAEQWPKTYDFQTPLAVWRNRDYLVVHYREGLNYRLTINRTDVDANGEWKDGITWDELNRIKCAVGFRERTCIEVFPPESRIVNVANMRHLWIVPAAGVMKIPVWDENS